MYGAETLAAKKAREKKLDVAEMRIFRRMYGVRKKDRIGNKIIRGTANVNTLSKKGQEIRLMWYGHFMRKDEECVGERLTRMNVEKKERMKPRWMDSVKSMWT